jgi:hypothetical protein
VTFCSCLYPCDSGFSPVILVVFVIVVSFVLLNMVCCLNVARFCSLQANNPNNSTTIKIYCMILMLMLMLVLVLVLVRVLVLVLVLVVMMLVLVLVLQCATCTHNYRGRPFFSAALAALAYLEDRLHLANRLRP